ncbi:MAG: hydrogenase/urease maturation nickel metallochaperone HypA [Nanoarchaeota archaeon]|nr:hydrogenase/urease maturation nickel metallochaperone HypA [Nanoarchaeota archaeon]
MHETAIAEGIIVEAKKHGSVKAISLEIGELAHVPGAELVECLRRLVDWKVEWKERPAVASCGCGYQGAPVIVERGHDFFLIECPKCTQVPDLTDGDEIKLVDVTVD